MENDETALVERARAGDQDAYRGLVEAHSGRLFALAYRLTGHEQTAEDVVQEALIKAHRNLGRFDSRARFGTWLHRITVNCAMDLLRKQQRRQARAPMQEMDDMSRAADHDPGPERRALSGEIGKRVEDTLAGLSSMERTAFVLRHFEGQPIADIAAVLGVQPNACKHAVFRAVKKLRGALAPLVREGHETAY